MSGIVRPMSMKQASYAWDILRYARVVVKELDASQLKVDPADTAQAAAEISTWRGPKWAPNTPDWQRKMAEFEVAACRARLLAERGVGHHEIQPLLDYWPRVSNRSDMTLRRKAETIIERLAAIGLTGEYVGGDEPPRRPRTTTMVTPVQPPGVAPAPQPVPAPPPAPQPPAPAPAPAPQGMTPLEVFQKIQAMKALGLTDEQIEGLLKLG